MPRARRFTAEALAAVTDGPLVADAVTVVSELVTNALLHGRPPVSLVLRWDDAVVRVEVSDGSGVAPVRGRPNAETMTGRGIRLVESLSHRWGVAPNATGKTVWAELVPVTADAADEGAPADPAAVDRLLASWSPPTSAGAGPTYTVVLGDVPTDLLLAAKSHVDNLLREFALLSGGADAGSTSAVPPDLAGLIERVAHRFTEARQGIKRQALAAAATGEPRTHLSLTLPLSAADAGDAYLAALDEADRYARAARLLTLEAPPQHRAFRRWYVESITTQLRAFAAGQPVPETETFEQRLLAELETVSAARRIADRGARLQSTTAALAGTVTVDEVTTVVVREGLAALDATSGTMFLEGEQGLVTVSSALGYPPQVVEAMGRESVDAALPGATVLRTGEAVWLESRERILEAYPALSHLEPGTRSLCAVPVTLAGRVLGALRFSFSSTRMFDDDERRFILALAAQTAQALDRNSAYAAERAARSAAESLATRLRRLQELTGALAKATEPDRVAEIIVSHAGDALDAESASLSLLVDDGLLRIAAVNGVSAEVARKFRTFALEDDLPASECIRRNQPVVLRSWAELVDRYPALAVDTPREGSLVCLPLHTGDRRLGAISVRFPPGQDATEPDELDFLGSLADAAAQAIDRARAQGEAAAASAKLVFLAEASAELASSLDYRNTLTNVARLLVPRLADWCSIAVVENGRQETVVVAHTDPAKVAFAEELQRRYPSDPDSPTGVPRVLRTGHSELYPEISDEMLVAGVADEEHLRLARELRLSSALIVPLAGRGGTFGALSLVHAESGRRYGEADMAFVEEFAARAAMAVENAREFHEQSGRLAEITRIAEAAQHAILAPVPPQVGPVALAAAYVSAARDALVGGDLYEVVPLPGSLRLLIGDVRGKGLDAVRLATIVLGYFRAAAVDAIPIAEVARRVDVRLVPHLGAEDFVTALLVDFRDDGRVEIVSCGHPGPLHGHAGRTDELACPPALPLGLGSTPESLTVDLEDGDRLLLYTDGLIEARDQHGAFADLGQTVEALRTARFDCVLDRILEQLRETIDGDLDDDLALLVAEFRPDRS